MPNDSPSPPIDLGQIMSAFKGVFSITKDILPWVVVLYNLIFGFGVKQSTSDHNLQTMMEDHVTLEQVRKVQNELVTQQSRIAAQVELLVKTTFEQGPNHAK